MKYCTAGEAHSDIRSGMGNFVYGSSATPTLFIETLSYEFFKLTDIELIFISVLGDFRLAEPKFKVRFHLNSLFVYNAVRESVMDGAAVVLAILNLFGKNLGQRRASLLSIAHLEDCAELEKAFYNRFGHLPINK